MVLHPDSHAFPLLNEVYRVGKAIQEAGGRPVLVGGWVRDSLLGHPHSKDFDMEVFGLEPRALNKVLRRFGPVHQVGRHFGVLKLTTREAEYDVSVPRRESKVGKGHKGFWVSTDPGMTFEEASSRRDFTMNAMGYALMEEQFIDPHHGFEDLRAHLLRHVGPAFGEDPLRVLRALQFAGRFGLDIAPETQRICREQDLHELPRERQWVELKKLLLLSARPSHGFGFAESLGVLPYYPELAALHAHQGPAGADWQRTMRVLDAVAAARRGDEAQDLAQLLTALCHRLGAPAMPQAEPGPQALADAAAVPAQALLERFTNEHGLIEAVLTLLREAPLVLRAAELSDGDVRRMALRVKLPEALRAAEALYGANPLVGGHAPDAGAAPLAEAATLRRHAAALGVLEQPPAPLLKGRHLMQAGMRPGPAMGDLLKAAFEAQLDGAITSEAQALAWMAEALGRQPHLLESGS